MNPATKQLIVTTPRTKLFSFDEIGSGFGGPTVINSGKLYWLALNGMAVSAWIGRIKGTSCSIKVRNAGDDYSSIMVSVDGKKAVSAIPYGSGDIHYLFKDLEDTLHTIVVMPGAGAYYQYFSITDPAIFAVTGASPEIIPANTIISAGDFQANTVQSGFFESYSQGGNTQTGTVPATLLSRDYGGGNPGGCSTICFKSDASHMIITSNSHCLFVCIDGTTTTRYGTEKTGDNTNNLGATPLPFPLSGNTWDAQGPFFSNFSVSWTIALPPGTHTYNVWTGGLPNSYNLFVIGLDKPLLTLPGTPKRLDQFGDSLTAGLASTSMGEVETMRVAAYYGYAGATYGLSGETIGQFATRLPNLLNGITATANDVAVIAQGRNGSSTDNPLSGGDITAYTGFITALLAKGYGKVLCRGIIPEQSPNRWTANNASIAAIVSGLADSRVVYVPVTSWADQWVSCGDGTHPGDFGYTQWTALAIASYNGLI
jgi:hypothetical protein